MKAKVTVLVPTHDHASLLLYAVRSALAQTVEELEIFIIGDGVSDDTRDVVRDLSWGEPRIRFFDRPKGPRHGEIYRHEALQHAEGEIVCYLCDDDLWLPNHAALMLGMLKTADVVTALIINVAVNGVLKVTDRDYNRGSDRQRLLRDVRGSGTGLTFMSHTLSHYRRLPTGWTTTPRWIYTDQLFLKQALSTPGCTVRSAAYPSAMRFGDRERPSSSTMQRVAELEFWTRQIQSLAQSGELTTMFQGLTGAQVAERLVGSSTRSDFTWIVPLPRRIVTRAASEALRLIKRGGEAVRHRGAKS